MKRSPFYPEGDDPCPFDMGDFWNHVGHLTPAQVGFAVVATMVIWNSPERRITLGDLVRLARFPGVEHDFRDRPSEDFVVPDRDAAEVLGAVFWLDGRGPDAWVYSPFVQKWLGIPQRRVPIPRRIREAVKRHARQRDGGRLLCEYCRKDCSNDLHFDHRLPVSRGGINCADNIAVSCSSCNLRKGLKTDAEFWAEFAPE